MKRFAGAGVVFAKELIEHVRDRRALFSFLATSLIGPALIAVMLNQIAGDRQAAEEIDVPVIGREHAPELMEWLEQQAGVTLVDAPEDPAEAVTEGDIDLVLSVDEEFSKNFARALPARVRLYHDEADSKARPKVNRVRRMVEGYGQGIGQLRLIARGVAPAVSRPLWIDDVEVSSAQRRASRVLAFVPLMLLVAAFAAGISPAVDSTAGERERGSLEPLLLNPVSAEAIAIGKWLAAAVFSGGGLLLSLGLMLTILLKLPLSELGIRLRIENWQIIGLIVAAAPIALLAPAFEMLVACYARSFKEAQAYLGYVMMIPMLPAVLIMVLGIDDAPWIIYVPILAQTKMVQDYLAAEAPAWWEMMLAGGAAVALALVCIAAVGRLLSREKIIFGR